jgi:hypothetical protein
MINNIVFHRAVKTDIKLRFAVFGSSGCGKTYTLLNLATQLGGPVAFVDTEHGSARKYADLFEFDVLELHSFDPVHLIRLIDAAGNSGYRVVCIDSLSHFWMGKNGTLDQVDRMSKSSGNSFAAWRQVTPIHTALIEAIVAAPIHILAAMRARTEWILERDDKTGKTTPRKIGLAPVMRDGIEYEFDVCGEMDQDNTLVITKTRCPAISGGVFQRPGPEIAAVLKQWLQGGPSDAPATGVPPGQSITDVQCLPVSQNGNSCLPQGVLSMWKRMCRPRQIVAEFEKLEQEVLELGGTTGLAEYNQILREFGVHRPDQFKGSQMARLCARRVFEFVESIRVSTGQSPAAAQATERSAMEVAFAE